MDLELSGRVALVTGSYRGTGRGIAARLAAEGATLLLHGFNAEVAGREAARLRETGGDVRAVAGDVCSDDGAAAMVDAALAVAGQVDVLVNNYGVAAGPGWWDGTDDDWLDSYQRNVLSGVRLVRALVPGMRERGFGRVIFLGTLGTTRPGSRTPHYYAAKAALPSITVGLAKELAGSGITVNTVSPGLVATDEVRENFLRLAARRGWGDDWPEVERRVAAEFLPIPCGRLARVEEVGDLVAFLASPRAGYINGANLRIDGGAADAVT